MQRLLIDTDPGIDDAMAIFYALRAGFDVVGLTTIFGNHHTEICTRNALTLLEIADRTDIPVVAGATRPLVHDYRGPADFVHGADGQGNVHLPPPTTSAADSDAAHFIVEQVVAAPGEITLAPLGPLTNVALAMLLEPRLSSNLAGIVLMGGAAFVGGNKSPAAEANILNDAEAADIVFGADCDIVMAGLDVTAAHIMPGPQIDRIGRFDNPMAQHLAAILPFYRQFYADREGIDGIYVHDSTVISYLLRPDLFTWEERPIRVDTGSSVCRGRTQPAKGIADQEGPWAGRRPVRILTGSDMDALVELELSYLADTHPELDR